ncbi:MAG: hypothetical protein R2747_00790 [Pyrinomonadaceae bacterium]
MWHEDLSKYTEFGEKFSKTICGDDYAEILIAVGWLEKGKTYATGETPKGVCERLLEFRKTSVLRLGFCGRHQCDFCGSEFIDEFGAVTIFVAYKNKIYVCPDLIVHYIEKHSYLPPAEFIEAVLAHTPQESQKYFKKFWKSSETK